MTQHRRIRTSKLALGLLAALAAAPAMAQSTSSGIAGTVLSSGGAPVADAEVTITHVESGTISRATTDAAGRYTARGLRVGGPYTVTINKPGEGTDTEDGIYLDLNRVNTVNVALKGDVATLETVTAIGVASSNVFSADNKGVGTSISGRQLEVSPHGNRSLDDVARLDPRINVTDQATGAISVAGVNNRYNSISVDGLGQGDPFGLNANGMPYTGSPISVDTIAAYDIKASDFDVSQDTVGAAINAVTKSGTNEFHGSVYYAYKNAKDMVGSEGGKDYDLFDKDTTKGVTIGGPILKDKLFFFGSYEEQEVTNFGGASADDGVGSGAVSQADIQRVIDIAKNTYGIDAGTYGALGVSLKNKRYLGKIDWNINDYHRTSLTYQQTEENLPQPYDTDASKVILSTRWFNKVSETKNTALQFFDDWSENFSTEAKFSYQKFSQIAGNAIDLPSINVATDGLTAGSAPNNDGNGIRFGEDRNRHENAIDTKKFTASIFGNWYLGDHTLKFGFDYEKTKALNLYGRDLHGVYTFASIDDFEAGRYSYYTVTRPLDGYTEADTAAAINLEQWSPFLQDTWQATDRLSLVYGVRVNIPKADKAPPEHPQFEEAFGFSNSYKLGASNKVVLPRLAFNYAFDTPRYSQLRGGVGLFQTTPPFVWLGNPYQNNGVNKGSITKTSYDPNYPFSADPYNQPFPEPGAADYPTVGKQVDAIDPDFKLPTAWKFSLGYDAELPWWGLVGTAEILHLKNKDAVFYQALNIGQANGQLFDGRDSYWVTPGGAKNNGANPNFTSGSNGTTLLGNTDKGGSTAVTFALDKPLSNGWYGNLSYTYTHAREVGSDTSSQAWSSYQYVSRLNPNEEIASTATREVRNSIKLSLGWEHAFFGDYKTSITGFYNGRSGLPYTWIMNGDLNGDGISQDPAYVPLVNDSNVSYVWGTGSSARAATAEEIAAFQAAIDSNTYLASQRGSVVKRNGDRMPWINQFDLGIQQEIPGFFKEHKGVVRLDIYNFLNMLNKDWGVTKGTGSTNLYDTRYLAGLNRVNPDGTYVYNLQSNAPQPLYQYDAYAGSPSRVVSRWSALVTLRYEF
ncbi:TonB-dependent receptor [Pseudoxanthomonas sp.]|uniref:TonB-dependent receptor n=1 Tax=Pseudoxanthomonas sp. TaxID=1871049 RepID=UPI002627ADB1|nr:TonB-dependent receptor [Pseudoxanthomonas sp.]WDS36035.1 MAG: TonB-dependent receptor [Pseudoxanthomonas sp.]